MIKLKEFLTNPNWVEPFWSIRAFFIQPITPIVHFSTILQAGENASWDGGDAKTDKYVYYTLIKENGRRITVKVHSIEVLRYEIEESDLRIEKLENELSSLSQGAY